MKTKIYISYAILCIIWGTTWFAMKVSLNEGMAPTYAAGIRFIWGCLIFWFLILLRRERIPLTKRAWSIYLQFGLLNFGIGYVFTYWATQYIYSNLASILWASFPIITSIMAHFYLSDEKLNTKRIISLFLGILGTILIIANSGNLGGENVYLGVIVILIGIIISAWPNTYLMKHKKIVNTFQLNAVSQSIGGILLFTIAKIISPNQTMIWTQNNILATAYLVIFGSVLTFSLYFWLFDHLKLSQITYVTFISPIVAIFVGWIFLDEKLSILIIIGAALILFGALLVNYKRK